MTARIRGARRPGSRDCLLSMGARRWSHGPVWRGLSNTTIGRRVRYLSEASCQVAAGVCGLARDPGRPYSVNQTVLPGQR